MNELNKFKSDFLVKGSVCLVYYFTAILLLPIKGLVFLSQLFGILKPSINTVVLIESGVKGWDLLEYKELYQSACEYVGEDSVCKLMVDREMDYFSQVRKGILKHQPSHYIYDPRTGSQSFFKGLFESFKIALLFACYNVTPIVVLADFSMRGWRLQSAIVTALRGVVVTYLSFKVAHPIFPHNRVLGPYIMPLSMKTAKYLQVMSDSRDLHQASHSNAPKAVFAGSVYEPRLSTLEKIKEELQKKNLDLDIKGRQFGTPKAPESEYWETIVRSDIMITTTAQIYAQNADWLWLDSLVYRFLEVMVCGTLLVATEPPGGRRFFIPGIHYISFTTPAEAAELIEYYLQNSEERRKIATEGQRRAQALINSRFYFSAIDSSLGKHSLI